MNILITGINSYIGNAFFEYACKKETDWKIAKISLRGALWKKENFSCYDVILHVAGKAHADVGNVSQEVKEEYYRVNRDLTLEIAQKAKREGVKQFIYLSSMIIYGDSAPVGKTKMIHADTVPSPDNFYGDSKWQADQGIAAMNSEMFKTAVVRIPMVYGKGSKGNYPMLSKIAGKLNIFPDIVNQRSMIYIENLCEFFREIIVYQDSGIFHPQNPEYTKTSKMVATIAKVHGKKMHLTKCLNPLVQIAARIPGKIGKLCNKAFGNSCYDREISTYRNNEYQIFSLKESIKKTEEIVRPKALMTASVASMIDLFSMDNIRILQQQGYEVEVAANFEFGSITSEKRVKAFQEKLGKEGIKVYHVPIPRSIGDIKNIITSYNELKKICRRERYAIVHTQSPIGGVVARLAVKGLRKKGTRVVYTAHGFHFYHGAPKKNWMLFYTIEKFLARYTDVLITINQEDYQTAQKFHAQKVCYVPGIGIEVEKYKTNPDNRLELRKELGLLEKDFVVLSVGQLSRRKNQQTVIRAMAELKENTDIRYVIVGLGECQERYEALIQELQLENKVILAGYRGDVNNLLHMADCFAFPSLQEGLPVALMEAMAAGLPVVCSNIRGNKDLVTDRLHGRVIESGDVKGYADAILEMKENPSQAALYCRNAGEKIKEFGNKKVRSIMEEIYKELGRT